MLAETKQKFDEAKQLKKQIADTTKDLNSWESSPPKIRLGLLRQLVIMEEMAKPHTKPQRAALDGRRS